MIYYAIIPGAVLIDQLVKHLIAARLSASGDPGQSFVPGLIDLVYVENTGAAFNIMQGKREFLIAFTALMIAALIVYIFVKRKSESSATLTGFSLVAGGGLGNLIDRVRLGFVVDYIELKLFSFPVFNIADILVCAGCGLILLHFAFAEIRVRRGKTADGSAE